MAAEILAPAGSMESVIAAVRSGADAVYLGGPAFNARMNAHNFGGDALRSAVLRAHTYGVKVYLTLLQFGLLNAEKVRIQRVEYVLKAFLLNGSETINIP